jgi:hypothetical protein
MPTEGFAPAVTGAARGAYVQGSWLYFNAELLNLQRPSKPSCDNYRDNAPHERRKAASGLLRPFGRMAPFSE